MKKTLRNIISTVLVLNMLMFAIGCTNPGVNTGKDNNDSQAQIVNGPSTVNPSGSVGNNNGDNGNSGNQSADVSGFSKDAFASKIEGTYFAIDEGGAPFALSIYNYYGNVYAYGGYVESEDELDVYSFWMMEFIPEDPRDFYYENTNEARIGVLTFSIMSNFGRYWSAPVEGVISLTDDGIKIEGDEALCPIGTNGRMIELSRSEKVEDFFMGDIDSYASENFATNCADENLYGIWKQKDSDNPWFITFEKGEEFAEASVYQKTGGIEANLCTGYCDLSEAGSGEMIVNQFRSGSPEVYRFSYELNGDELEFAESFYFIEGGKTVFERVDINDIPIVALYDPDNLDAIKGEAVLDVGGKMREICAHFRATQDVANNGTDFVRVGDVVFFRYYDLNDFSSFFADWGQFINAYELNDEGCVCYFDLNTRECGLAYRDYCSGPLYYVNGKFYSERFEANEVYSVEYLMSCYPDGSALEEWSDTDTFSEIEAVSDESNSFAVYQFLAGNLYIDYGNAYRVDLNLIPEDYVYAVKISGDSIYVVTANDSDKIRLTEYQRYYGGEGIVLAEYDAKDIWKDGYAGIYQIEVLDDSVHVGINHVVGKYGQIKEIIVLEAEPGVENSGKVEYKGLPDLIDIYGRPYFYHDYNFDLVFADVNPDGDTYLSEDTYGNLCYYNFFDGVELIRSGFIEENPHAVYDGMTAEIFQEAENIDGLIFAVTATSSYAADKDIGETRCYLFRNFNYTVINSRGDEPDIELNPVLTD
ncbi:MAG: hypothetical protein J6X97_01545 [Lachnospiraceae bacterium]|nr:hypothetical protein [Lachnospiraceae bacterium]